LSKEGRGKHAKPCRAGTPGGPESKYLVIRREFNGKRSMWHFTAELIISE